MARLLYWLKKSMNWNWKYCGKFCVTCKYYETCKRDEVLE